MSVEIICIYILLWMVANWIVAYVYFKKEYGCYFYSWEKQTLLDAVGIIISEILIGLFAILFITVAVITHIVKKVKHKRSNSSK